LEQKTDEEYVILERRHKAFLTADNCTRFLSFCLGAKSDCWLPCKDIEESLSVFDQHNITMGERLKDKTMVTWDWTKHGYFTYRTMEEGNTEVIFNADVLAPKRRATLPYPATLMETAEDWAIVNNDNVEKAALESKSLLIICPLLPLFLAKYPEGTAGRWAFFEISSFEADGRSQPECFLSEAVKKKLETKATLVCNSKKRRTSTAVKTVLLPPLPARPVASAVVAPVVAPAGAGLVNAPPPLTG
jgi:hypothetical protein